MAIVSNRVSVIINILRKNHYKLLGIQQTSDPKGIKEII